MTRLAIIELLQLPTKPRYTQQVNMDTLVLLNEGLAELKTNVEADGSGNPHDVLGVVLSEKGIQLRDAIFQLAGASS